MKKIIITLIVLVTLSACNKNAEKKVEYEVTAAVSEYNLQYIDEFGELIKTTVNPESALDVWQYNFIAKEGDIVYVSGKYDDINSALRISIKIDGKIYKESYSVGDTVKYLVVSGVIPYE